MCTAESLDDIKVLIDGGAAELRDLTRIAGEVNVGFANSNNCSAITRSRRNRIIRRSDTLYDRLWNVTWIDIPADHYTCEEPHPSCSEFALDAESAELRDFSGKLERQVKRMLTRGCVRGSRTARTFLRRAAKLRRRIRRNARTLPDPLLSCDFSS
jgi:hypothetical protein